MVKLAVKVVCVLMFVKYLSNIILSGLSRVLYKVFSQQLYVAMYSTRSDLKVA